MKDYTPPTFRISAFNCPHCQAYAKQSWFDALYRPNSMYLINGLTSCYCEHCNDYSLWLGEKMLYPFNCSIPLPNADLPREVVEDYNEAREILNSSPRGAAALLRLSIQKLCRFLGEKGENINLDIKNLVSKGLPLKVQQSLDILRVVGNNAVHPGKIDLKDNKELATALFGLVNIIADVMITQPKHVEELYGGLPANLLESIEKRDKK